ncbi:MULTISPECIES: flagellin N-terminal helical domain-containing protein [unclassified Pseudobutyrivibrio]|uniref:flagellin N-terminal helical domain-containing protein n=1 Tax=unclassified Pseudobutyrivibrio TaxID=2638619 RepID=UPI0005D14A8B|nr:MULTISPECIES: flagellin [unclassified Pseudobutyrivibrio]SET03641.1 flagellin [Pseudobutyrivibrio sp. C4]
MVVQHNMQAANASRMLNITTGNQSKSTEKLSSGYKINRAADDAAGLSISEKMRKQIRGLDQASTNAQDGVSAVQTAEGALTEVHSMLQRMNELAVQASNGTNSESDRSSIQDEINQLTTEIDRVAETTKFNETYLLKGDYGKKTIQIKAHDAGLDGTLTQNTTTATFTVKALSMGDKVTIGGTEYRIGVYGADTETQLENAKTILNGGNDFGVGQVVKIDGKSFTMVASGKTNVATSELAFDELEKFAGKGSTIEYNGKEVTLFNEQTAEGAHTGVDTKDSTLISQQKAYELMANELKAASSIGASSVIADPTTKVGTDSMTAANANIITKAADTDKVTFTMTKGTAEVQKDLTFNLHVGSDADMTNKIGVTISDMSSASLGVDGLNVADATGKAATYAIDAIADAVEKVSAQRSSLGAIQNRLEHTIANVDNVVENTNAAESRIRDTDMADEMVTYSKNNILAQAGQAMLAQANQATQGVLSILG